MSLGAESLHGGPTTIGSGDRFVEGTRLREACERELASPYRALPPPVPGSGCRVFVGNLAYSRALKLPSLSLFARSPRA